MNEKLLSDYIKDKELSTYPNFAIEDIQCAGEWVMFKERDAEDGMYAENHMIMMLNIVAWVYSKVEA